MANFPPSPGVKMNEIDNTFITPEPVNIGAAIIGPTVKGPVEIPTVITSYSDYRNRFGSTLISGSDSYSYFTSIAAYNYFNNGGESLLIARLVSSSADYTPATGTAIGTYLHADSSSFTIETLSEGEIMNSSGSLNTNGSLITGTEDNLRWQITTANTGSGTFNLLVRRGDDNTADPIVLEAFNSINLDPNSSRYISKVIGDQVVAYNATTVQADITSGTYDNVSRYIRVSAVTSTTPDYIGTDGNFNPAYTSSIPINGSGSFSGAGGTIAVGANFYENIAAQTQGLVEADYTNMVNLLKNTNDYQFNVLLTPGFNKQFTFSYSSIGNIKHARKGG